jgi:hypothetical protein
VLLLGIFLDVRFRNKSEMDFLGLLTLFASEIGKIWKLKVYFQKIILDL